MVCNAWNRLVAVKDANDDIIVTYEYDALNRRIVERLAGGVPTRRAGMENR